MTLTLDQIKSIALQNRPDLDSYTNCNPINPTIQKALENHGISVQRITGTISTGRSHIGGEEHMYLKIPSKEVTNFSSHKDIIVDGAIDQFCDENYNDCIFVTLGPKEDLPTVAVLTSSDEFYPYFYEEENW